MATLHLMVGLQCSGKTTLAKKLEVNFGAPRLTADEWHRHLLGQDATHPDHDERHARAATPLIQQHLHHLVLGELRRDGIV